MTTELLDVILEFFDERDQEPYAEGLVAAHIRAQKGKEHDAEDIFLGLKKLVKEGFISEKEVFHNDPYSIEGPGRSYVEIYYRITFDGKQLRLNGGYSRKHQLEKEKETIESDKRISELAFIQASNKMIPFQKRQTKIATGLTIVSLLFIILSFYQTYQSKQDKELELIRGELNTSWQVNQEMKNKVNDLTDAVKALADTLAKK